MRKHLRKLLPDHRAVSANRWLAPFSRSLLHPRLWHLNRRSAAGAVAAGLFCGLIPGPFQMLAAAIVCVACRFNLPLALFTTLYTNPFTIVPLYVAAYALGSAATGGGGQFVVPPEWGAQGLVSWVIELGRWLVILGKPLAVGLVILASVLAAAGYALMLAGWRYYLVHAWRERQARRMARS